MLLQMGVAFSALALLLTAASGSVQARPSPTLSSDVLHSAEKAFRQGMIHYDLGEFEDAIHLFKRAYELSKQPGLIFNIAQAHRLAGNIADSVYAYHTFLRLVPNAPNREDVERRIADLEAMLSRVEARASPRGISTEHSSGPQQKSEPTPLPPPVQTTIATARRERAGLAWARGAFLGSSAAFLAIGGGLALRSRAISKELERFSVSGGVWTTDLQRKIEQGERFALSARVTLGVGAAFLLTGSALLIAHRASETTTLALAPTLHGVVASVQSRF